MGNHHRCPFEVSVVKIEGTGLVGFYSIYQELFFPKGHLWKPHETTLREAD